MPRTLTRSQFVRWRTAIFAIFMLTGLVFVTWASRIPAIKEALDISKTEVGMLLVSVGISSIIGLSASSVILARWGAKRGMLVLLLCAAVGLTVVGIGSDMLHSYPTVVIGLALFGFGHGATDVLMNVEGAAVEKYGGKTVLPMAHGFYSLGTFVGAGIGAAAAALNVSVAIHAVAMAAVVVVVTIIAVANVPVDAEDSPEQPAASAASFRERLHTALSAWREPRTYGLGLVLVGMAFAEGGANDWLALGLVEGHGAEQWLGAVGLAVFSGAMTLARMLGGPIVDRFGRVPALRVLAVFAAGGLLLFILAPNIPLVFVGAILWGIGVSLGFPLGLSAAADDPAKAAARVSAAATIGYVAFLCGPPLLGFIADHIGLLNTLYVLVGLVVISGLASGAAKPLATIEEPAPAHD